VGTRKNLQVLNPDLGWPHNTLWLLADLFLEGLKGEVILADVFHDVPIGLQPEAH
jgi:hypothetical protein